MARYAEILERRQRDEATYLYCRIYMDGAPDVDGEPTTIELGNVEIPDASPIEVRASLVDAAKRLLLLPVGKVIDL